MDRKAKMKQFLYDAVASEMQAAVQYMWQHVAFPDGFRKVKKEIKKIAIEEMRHAEDIAEELLKIDAKLPLEVRGVVLDDDPRSMLARDMEAEQAAIDLYTRIIRIAGEEGFEDVVELFTKIRKDEMRHKSTFSNWLQTIF